MKRALLVVGVVLAICGVLVAILLTLDVNQFRPQIEAQMQKALKRPVTLGAIGLKIFPLALTVDNVTIGESPALQSPRPFVTARQIRLRAGLLALLRKQLDIQSLVLDQPSVELIKMPKGGWNFSDIAESGSGSGSGGQPSLGLAKLEIADGKVGLTDRTAGGARTVYDHIDLLLSGYAPGKRFDIDAAIRFPKGGRASVKGTGGPLPSTAFTGKASLKDVSLASVRGFLGTEKLDADAVLSGDATLSASGETTNIDGDLTATDVRYGAIKLPHPVDADYRVVNNSEHKTLQIPKLQIKSGDAVINAVLSVPAAGVSGTGTIQNLSLPVAGLTEPVVLHSASFRLDPGAAKAENLRISLGKTNVTGTVSVRNFSAPDLQFAANIDQVDYAEIQKLTASTTQSQSKSKSERPPNVTGNGTVQVGSLRYNNLQLTDVKANCTLDRGLIRLSPISAQSAGGHITGDMQYDGRREPARVSASTKLDRLDANQLLSSTTSLKDTITGRLSGDTQVDFVARPGEDLARSLNGTARVQLTDGKIQRVNILNELSNIGKFLGGARQSQPFTNIVKLAGTMVIKDGVANTDDLKLDLEGASVGAAGTVNLVDQALNMKVTAVLSKELSQKAGGNQIGGFMSTVLANPQGELVIPAIVTGTLSQPHFVPDAQRMAQMKMKNLLPSTANPTAGGVQGIVDALRGRKQPPAAGNQQGTPQQGTTQQGTPQQGKPTADSIIDLFRKKK